MCWQKHEDWRWLCEPAALSVTSWVIYSHIKKAKYPILPNRAEGEMEDTVQRVMTRGLRVSMSHTQSVQSP